MGHSGPLASGMHWCEGARLVFWSAIRLTRVDGALRQDGEARAPIKPGALGTRGGSDRASRLVVWVRIDGYFRFHVTRSSLVSFPGTSNSGWCPVMGPRSVVENRRSWSSARADLILGPARALLILVGARSWDLAPWFGNRRSWWSARADVSWSCTGCLLRLARVFLGIDPSPTLVGIPWQGASFLLRGSGTYGVRCLQGHISSWVLLGHFQFCSTWVTGKFYLGQQAWYLGKFYPGHGEVLPGSTSMVPDGTWGSSTRVTGKFYPGQQAWYLGKFYPGHGEVLPVTTMSSDAEVAGCSMIRLELGSRGPVYPGCFARPWLEWSVARGASVSFGCWKGGCPPSSAKMLMPKTLPAATPNVVGGLSRVRALGATRPGRLRNNPRQVAASGDVTRCRSGQAEPAVDGTCVRKGVTGGTRASRALSLWNALVRGGSSGILVG
ncbi:hypothetical protein TIFTF001_053211 [Ficus carica]|uniref:Uncharacterized protein n=1 Tax=Ficus carica TaxID=3494 RepID=A0AA88EIG5_FICCA|nr:hypothetical protein TIFTF001_053211 [Ficus carica]